MPNHKQWLLSHFILVLILSLSVLQFFEVRQAKNKVTFLEVGQGDSILIQTQEGKNILIDAGPDGKVVERLSETLPFFNQNIDLFILTHPDLDHYGGALDVLQKYPIKQVMLTGVASGSQLYQAFVHEIKEKKIPIVYPQQDRDLKLSPNLFVDVLYPFENASLLGQEVKSKNDTSVSMVLRNGKGEGLFLLTGDGEEKQEIELLLSAQDVKAERFKLGHHGSKTSSSPDFLAAIQAKEYVVSAGKDNKFGHPHEEVLVRLEDAKIYSTATQGNLEFVLE